MLYELLKQAVFVVLNSILQQKRAVCMYFLMCPQHQQRYRVV